MVFAVIAEVPRGPMCRFIPFLRKLKVINKTLLIYWTQLLFFQFCFWDVGLGLGAQRGYALLRFTIPYLSYIFSSYHSQLKLHAKSVPVDT